MRAVFCNIDISWSRFGSYIKKYLGRSVVSMLINFPF